MKQLSFRYTNWYRRGIILAAVGGPFLWGLFFFCNQTFGWMPTVISSGEGAAIAIGAFVIGSFSAYQITKGLKEVWLEGDELIVRAGRREARVPLLEVAKVTPSRYWSPERLRLDLSRPSELGQRIVFIMPTGAGREVVHRFVQELDRVHRGGAEAPGGTGQPEKAERK